MQPPKAKVKVPLLIRFGKLPPKPYKVGRGFSVGEIKAVGLSIKEARLLGLYVDEQRDTVHEENIAALKEWLEKIRKGEISVEDISPTLPKRILVKRKKGRVFRGLTCAGRRMRGLLSVKLKETHKYKWKKKSKERKLKKRHEAQRSKGGH
ncbi:MAG: hypothetical protein DRJ52_00400 [Thermoprotei archaeon]|nr:MAG: hypothetical protein DRJ52_00400 [Thermoprotei archaeon]RLF00308.1 MAG: hypothetical protein DRJ63_02835 [Thermoprotei archaeon]HDI75177.1 hypothetical protein [Thermoprotei archaeon]